VGLLPPPLLPPRLRIQVQRGYPPPPPRPHRHPGGAPGMPSLFPHPRLLIVGTVHFPLHRVLR
jgi:hypothetical protein